MAGQIVRRSSVVLIHYPFTDLTGAKVRPAIILTPDELLARLDDVLCLFVSSSMPVDLLPTDLILETTHVSFSRTGLKYRSIIRTHKLVSLQKSLILRVLGEVDKSLMFDINKRLRIALGL